MIILTHFGSSAWNIVGVLTLTKAPIIARIVRGLTLELREREYVAAAKMRGESALYIMLVEILPNARGPLLVDMCLRATGRGHSARSEEHTSELQSLTNLVCRLLLEKKKTRADTAM